MFDIILAFIKCVGRKYMLLNEKRIKTTIYSIRFQIKFGTFVVFWDRPNYRYVDSTP